MRLEPRRAIAAWRSSLGAGRRHRAARRSSAALLALAGAPTSRPPTLLLGPASARGSHWSETLTRATPLILTGLAAAVAFRARLWNIGAEGQLYVGARGRRGARYRASAGCRPCCCSAPAAGSGARRCVDAARSALLKVRLGVDEVVTTLLLNFIVLLFVGMLLEGPMKDPMAWAGRNPRRSSPTRTPAAGARNARPRRLHHRARRAVSGLALIKAHRWLRDRARSATTRRPPPSPACRSAASWCATALLSGALAGLAGAIEVAGLKGYLTSTCRRVSATPASSSPCWPSCNPLGVVLGGDLRRRRVCRCRQHEPRRRRAELHRRRDRRGCRCSPCWSPAVTHYRLRCDDASASLDISVHGSLLGRGAAHRHAADLRARWAY